MATPPVLPRSRQRLVLAVLTCSAVLIWLDNTILSTALETLADPDRGLGATPGELQWSVGSYTLVFATLMFTAGALGDRFGHRTVLALGMAVFGLSSLWAAYAGSADELIAARAVMGVGSALVMPATMAIITFTFSPEDRAMAFGLFSSAAGVGVACGPVLAGLLLDHFWWGSVFLINVPVVVAALAGIAVLVPGVRSPRRRGLDPYGLVLSVTGLGLLAYGLIRAGQEISWSGTAVWAPASAGLAILVAFVLVELRLKEPSFDPRLLATRVFGGGNAALGTLFFTMTAGSFFGAFYLQGARGFSPLEAGLAMLPAAVGVMLGGPLATRLVARWSVRPVTATALAVAALAMGGNVFFGLHTPLVWFELAAFVQGLSIGMVIAPVTNAAMGTLPLERAGAGSAVNGTVRQAGSLLGIAAGGTLMSIVYGRSVDGSLTGLAEPLREQARASAELARHVAGTLGRPDLAAAADRAFVHAMHVTAVWLMVIALAGAAILVAALRPEKEEPGTAAEPEPATASAGPAGPSKPAG